MDRDDRRHLWYVYGAAGYDHRQYGCSSFTDDLWGFADRRELGGDRLHVSRRHRIPLMPFFSVLMGNKRFYITILVLFTVGSMLCGLAWSLSALIFFRILQGIAGASMLPLSITLLFNEFPPEERGAAM